MLKMRFTLVLIFSALCAGAVWAGPPLSQDEAMKLLSQPGRWIDTDGAPQPDGTYLAKEIQIAATASIQAKEEPSIFGSVDNLDRLRSTMKVLGYVVTWDAETKIQDENKHVILTSKLQNGTAVKVQGKLQPNGSFKATKIKLQKMDKAKAKPKTKIYGPVTAVDARAGTLRVLNTSITLRPGALFSEQAPQAPGGKKTE
jgi:hypothetical protein